MTILLFMTGDSGRRGYGQLLDEFWAEAQRAGIPLPTKEPISAPAFCVARRKLMPNLLTTLLTKVCSALEGSHRANLLWHGRRVFAVDGSRFNLQRSDELAQWFGVPHGGHCPQVRVSTLFDIIGKVPHAATIAPGASCERQELLKLMPHLRPDDIVVLDRGYPSFEVLRAMTEADIDVVVRVPKSGTFEAIQVFQESGGEDYRVLVHPSAGAASVGASPLELRAVRIDAGGKEPWFLLTSLRRAHITLSQLAQLYHLRWEIEEFYKLLKSDYFSQRQFRSKSVLGVEQEIRAQLLFAALARLLMADASEVADAPYHEMVPKSGILALASQVIRLLLSDDPDQRSLDNATLLDRLARRRNKKRVGRSCARRSFKPGPRWNSKGKVGG